MSKRYWWNLMSALECLLDNNVLTLADKDDNCALKCTTSPIVHKGNKRCTITELTDTLLWFGQQSTPLFYFSYPFITLLVTSYECSLMIVEQTYLMKCIICFFTLFLAKWLCSLPLTAKSMCESYMILLLATNLKIPKWYYLNIKA